MSYNKELLNNLRALVFQFLFSCHGLINEKKRLTSVLSERERLSEGRDGEGFTAAHREKADAGSDLFPPHAVVTPIVEPIMLLV